MKSRIIMLVIALGGALLGSSAGAQDKRILTMDECKALSRVNDPYMRNADLDILAAKEQKGEALGEYFPRISLTSFGFRAKEPFLNLGLTDIIGTSDAAWNLSNAYSEYANQYGMKDRFTALNYGYGATVNVVQPIYAGGRIVAGNRLADMGVSASELKKGMTSREMDEMVEEKYWRIVSLQEKQKTLSLAIKTLDTLTKDSESALAAGLVTESDCMQVKLMSSELRSKEIQLRGGLRLAKMDLFNAVGVQYSPLSNNSDLTSMFIDDIILEDAPAVTVDPMTVRVDEYSHASEMQESRLLDLQVEAKRLEKRMVLGDYLPEIAVGGSYGYGQCAGIGQPRDNGMVYVVMKIPISDWGKGARKLRRYEYEIKKAENERDYLDSQLVLKSRQLWVNLDTSWEQMKVAEETMENAHDLFEKKRCQYLSGMCTMGDLLQAETSFRQSEDAFIDGKIAYFMALNSYCAR